MSFGSQPTNRRAGLRAAVLLAAWLCAGALAAAELPVMRVGVVVDGPWEGNAVIRELTRTEVVALTEGEFDVRFSDELYLVGDWTVDSARSNLDRLLNDPEVDAIITWGCSPRTPSAATTPCPSR